MPGLLTSHLRPVGPATVPAEVPSPRKNRLSLKFSRRREATASSSQGSEEEAGVATLPLLSQEADSASECASDIAAFNEVCDAVARGLEGPPAPPFVGLGNLGNTCYLNSVLQVLYHLPEFRVGLKRLNKLCEHEFKTEQKAEAAVPLDVSLLRSLARLMDKMSALHRDSLALAASENPVAHPSELLDILRDLNPMYAGYLQHDAQELLRCLLGHVQDACAPFLKDPIAAPRATAAAKGDDAGGCNGNDDKKRPLSVTSDKLATIKEESDAGKADEDSGEEEIEGRAGKRKNGVAQGGGNARKKLRNARQAGATGEGGRASGEDDSASEKTQDSGGSSPPVPSKRRRLGSTRRVAVPHSQPSILSKFRAIGKIVSGLTFRQSDPKSDAGDGRRSGAEAASGSAAPAPAPSGSESDGERSGGIDAKASRRAARNGGESACRDNGNGSTAGGNGCRRLFSDEDASRSFLPPVETGPHGGCVVGGLFQGELVLRTRCLECECGSERTESFLDVSLPVQDEEEQDEWDCAGGLLLNADADLLGVSPEPKAGPKSVQWALAQFARAERLVGRDKYFCETCVHHVEAERTLRFGRLPRILTLHLKRFSANGLCPAVGAAKVTAPVLTPRFLSVSEWLSGGPRSPRRRAPAYRLTALITHSGSTAGAGHYTAYARVASARPPGLARLQDRRDGGDRTDRRRKDGAGTGEGNGPGACPPATTDAAAMKQNGGGRKETAARAARGKSPQPATEERAACERDDRKPPAPGSGPPLLLKNSKKKSLSRSARNADAAEGEGAAAAPENGAGERRWGEDGTAARPRCNGANGEGYDSGDGVDGAAAREWEGRWLRFDDAEVIAVSEAEMASLLVPQGTASATPYLLFYRLGNEEDDEQEEERDQKEQQKEEAQ